MVPNGVSWWPKTPLGALLVGGSESGLPGAVHRAVGVRMARLAAEQHPGGT